MGGDSLGEAEPAEINLEGWRELAMDGRCCLIFAVSLCGIATAAIKGDRFEGLTAARHFDHRRRIGLGAHQQADGMAGDGPGALATGAVRGRSSRWYSLLRTPTQQTFDATHLHIQRATPYKCFAVVSGSKFDGAVSVDNDCIELAHLDRQGATRATALGQANDGRRSWRGVRPSFSKAIRARSPSRGPGRSE